MAVIAALCLVFGVQNSLPLDNLIVPALSGSNFAAAHPIGEHHFAGWPESPTLVVLTLVALTAALANHLYGARRSGSGLGAVDHIRYAPVLSGIYDKAERRWFDPYNLGMKLVAVIANIGWALDRINDWVYDGLSVGLARLLSAIVRLVHTGRYAWYMIWSLVGAAVVIIFLARSA
jgi:NADH-quinone oxidoreductase subunit L